MLVAALLGSFTPATAADPGMLKGSVIRAIDGETIEVLVGGRPETVRYMGIRTPVIQHPTKGAEPYRSQAAAANAALVEGQEVALQPGVLARDDAGRLLAFVFVNGRLINAELLRTGFAEAVTVPPNTQRRREFLFLQVQAQTARVGLWADEEGSRFYGPRPSGVIASRRTRSFFHLDDDQRVFDEQREFFESPEAAVRAGYAPSFNYPVYGERDWRTRRAAVAVPEPVIRASAAVMPVSEPPQPVGHIWRGGVITPIYSR
jgi:micrococcal nuclease